jgi:hypothetical protein
LTFLIQIHSNSNSNHHEEIQQKKGVRRQQQIGHVQSKRPGQILRAIQQFFDRKGIRQ